MRFEALLLILCLSLASCTQRKVYQPVEVTVVIDEQFFSKPIVFPKGQVNNDQRLKFAKDLEAAIDPNKTKLKEIMIRAEAPDKDVIALYAFNVSREECEALTASKVIQQSTDIGFRTFSCQDKENSRLISLPIKNRRGEIKIGQ